MERLRLFTTLTTYHKGPGLQRSCFTTMVNIPLICMCDLINGVNVEGGDNVHVLWLFSLMSTLATCTRNETSNITSAYALYEDWSYIRRAQVCNIYFKVKLHHSDIKVIISNRQKLSILKDRDITLRIWGLFLPAKRQKQAFTNLTPAHTQY